MQESKTFQRGVSRQELGASIDLNAKGRDKMLPAAAEEAHMVLAGCVLRKDVLDVAFELKFRWRPRFHDPITVERSGMAAWSQDAYCTPFSRIISALISGTEFGN